MAGTFVPPGKQRFVDPDTGEALVGGLVFMYIPSTDTAKDTYQDEALTILNVNPIILDADGQCTIWGTGLYRQVLQRADFTTVWDQVTGFLDGGTSVTFATPAQVAALSATDLVISPFALGASGVLGGGGGSGYGMHLPLTTLGSLSLDGSTVGSNDATIAAAEASTASLHFATPYGIIRTNLANTQLTKGYTGDAGFICGPGAGDGAYRPPNYAYMAVKPSTWPVQGDGGWFRGDMRFTDSGEWKIIGPSVRTFDITDRYYESTTIPHSRWLDTFSGNGGENAFLTSGQSIGDSTIHINGPATAAWVGQTMAFANGPDGAVVESHTVTSISGSTFSISPATLSNAYTWNPGAGQVPTVFVGHRTMACFDYTKIRHAGGGDSYGNIVRQNVNYVPEASEYHTFMGSTGGQFGGDVTFNSNGVYGQFMESQLQGGSFDVAAIGFVGSFVRNVDEALDGGKFWAGTWFQSGGTRPADAAHVVLGAWRNGLDTVFATLEETSRLTTGASPGTTVFHVASVNGAHSNDPFIIGSETLTIQTTSLGSLTVTTTAGCAGTYASDQLVVYPKGGAMLNSAKGQRWVMNSSLTSNGRSGDPLGVFTTLYGNVQGDMIIESGADGVSDFISIRFARGTTAAAPDTSRIRLRPQGPQFFSTAGVGNQGFTFSGADIGTNGNIAMLNGTFLELGTGAWLTFDGSHIKGTINGGSTYTTLV